MSRHIDRIFVAGAGNMGHGIAQVNLTAGVGVTLYDLRAAALEEARERIHWSLSKLADKGTLAEKPEAILARLHTTTDLQTAAEVPLVVEAVPEREDLKRELFQKLDALCPADTIFATNTSAIPIGTLAAHTARSDRFCGAHFFMPVPLMPLVEVIAGPQTTEQTIDAVTEWIRRIGKEPVRVAKDVAGFLVNRVLLAACVEAIELLAAGVGTAEDIDKAMRLGCNWRMGPLQTCDLSGLDVVLHALEMIDRATTGGRFVPPDLLKRRVGQGHLGRKTGRGFFEYPKEGRP